MIELLIMAGAFLLGVLVGLMVVGEETGHPPSEKQIEMNEAFLKWYKDQHRRQRNDH